MSELIGRYHDAVERYLRLKLRDQNLADEVFQEFWTKLLTHKLAGADNNKGRFRDYLRTVLHRLIIDHARPFSTLLEGPNRVAGRRSWPGSDCWRPCRRLSQAPATGRNCQALNGGSVRFMRSARTLQRSSLPARWSPACVAGTGSARSLP